MGTNLPMPADGMSAETRELLTAIRDALDLPHAATAADDEKRERLRSDNAVRVVSSIDYLFKSSHADVAFVTRTLQSMVAENPVDYVTAEEARKRAVAGDQDDGRDPCSAEFIDGSWTYDECGCVDCRTRLAEDTEAGR